MFKARERRTMTRQGSAAELGSAGSENVKVESVWAALCVVTGVFGEKRKKKKKKENNNNKDSRRSHIKSGSFIWML